MTRVLLVLVLVSAATAAPQLNPRPAEWWDEQIKVGLVVRGTEWGEMRLVEMKRSEWYPEKTLCRFVPCEPGHLPKDWKVWNCYKEDVSLWLRCGHIEIVRESLR